MNIHLIMDNANFLSGHTGAYTSVKAKFDGKNFTTLADTDGLFEMKVDVIADGTIVKITICLNGCFAEGGVMVPFGGEITLLKSTDSVVFVIVNYQGSHLFCLSRIIWL